MVKMRSYDADDAKPKENPLDILGVDPRISDAELRKRYMQLVRENPPERNPAAFQRIRGAYEALRRPIDRAGQALLQMEPPPAVMESKEGKAIGPLGVSPDWWLMSDPWSELNRLDFSSEYRDVINDIHQESLPLQRNDAKNTGL
ncbi:MAG TPA: J domain-containing protein [Firmicutes bacterium]|nr:J domain-containing protein [Bacillota bacterium]